MERGEVSPLCVAERRCVGCHWTGTGTEMGAAAAGRELEKAPEAPAPLLEVDAPGTGDGWGDRSDESTWPAVSASCCRALAALAALSRSLRAWPGELRASADTGTNPRLLLPPPEEAAPPPPPPPPPPRRAGMICMVGIVQYGMLIVRSLLPPPPLVALPLTPPPLLCRIAGIPGGATTWPSGMSTNGAPTNCGPHGGLPTGSAVRREEDDEWSSHRGVMERGCDGLLFLKFTTQAPSPAVPRTAHCVRGRTDRARCRRS